MTYSVKTSQPERLPAWIMFMLLLAVVAGASGAFIFGLATMLSWPQIFAVAVAAGAITGGTLFTLLEMGRLGRRGQ